MYEKSDHHFKRTFQQRKVNTGTHIAGKILKKRGILYEVVSIDAFLKMSVQDAIYEDDVFAISPALIEAAARAAGTSGGVIINHVITSRRIFDQLTEAFAECNIALIHVT